MASESRSVTDTASLLVSKGLNVLINYSKGQVIPCETTSRKPHLLHAPAKPKGVACKTSRANAEVGWAGYCRLRPLTIRADYKMRRITSQRLPKEVTVSHS